MTKKITYSPSLSYSPSPSYTPSPSFEDDEKASLCKRLKQLWFAIRWDIKIFFDGR